MVVAAGTPERQAQPRGGCGTDAVDHVFRLIFLGNSATLKIDHVITIEPGGDLLVDGGVGQEVSSQLLDGELVVRHVLVVGVDQPVSPVPHLAQAVNVVAVGVGVTRDVEPLHGHALAVVGRSKKLVNSLFVGVCRMVRKEGAEFCRRGWKPGQVESHSAQQGAFVCHRGGLQTF